MVEERFRSRSHFTDRGHLPRAPHSYFLEPYCMSGTVEVLGITWRAKGPGPSATGAHHNSSCFKEHLTPFYRRENLEPKLLLSFPEFPCPTRKKAWGPVAPASPAGGLHGEVSCQLPLQLWLGHKNSHGQGTSHPNVMAVLSSLHLMNFAIVLINKCYCSGFTNEKIGSRK